MYVASKKKIGATGEELAAEYLMKKGWKILDKNWRFGKIGEIDLIFLYEEQLIFVEVKSRTSVYGGYGEDNVTEEKLETIAELMDLYIQENPDLENLALRLDLMIVEMFKLTPRFKHIEDVEL